MLKNQNKSLAMLMLVVILATIFLHSGHSSPIKIDQVSSVEHHECLLCQQGLDSATTKLNIAPSSVGIFSAINVEINHVYLVVSTYVLAQLRAPPTLL